MGRWLILLGAGDRQETGWRSQDQLHEEMHDGCHYDLHSDSQGQEAGRRSAEPASSRNAWPTPAADRTVSINQKGFVCDADQDIRGSQLGSSARDLWCFCADHQQHRQQQQRRRPPRPRPPRQSHTGAIRKKRLWALPHSSTPAATASAATMPASATSATGTVATSNSKATASKLAPGTKVNLNTASADQLDALPEVGQARAKVIVTERAKGPFKDWTDFDTAHRPHLRQRRREGEDQRSRDLLTSCRRRR